MIYAQVNDLAIIGIEERNVEKLKTNNPMLIDTSKFKPFNQMLIVYGNTMEDTKTNIETMIGIQMPDLPSEEELKEKGEVSYEINREEN